MFGYGYSKTEDNCPNCGFKGWNSKKKDFECQQCGFHIIEAKEVAECNPHFCKVCGCSYFDICTIHPLDQQSRLIKSFLGK
jgi:hypothetical protein